MSLARCHTRPVDASSLAAADTRYPIWLKAPCTRVYEAISAAGDGGPGKAVELEDGPCWRCLRDQGIEPAAENLRSLLEVVLRDDVLPELRERHRANDNRIPPRLTQLLVERIVAVLREPRPAMADDIERLAVIARPLGWTAEACAELFEQVARHLGDAWSADTCTDLDVILALATLRAALYAMDQCPADGATVADAAPKVLVAAMPSEPHGLTAALDSETLRLAGWPVTEAIAPTVRDLRRRLRTRHYDVLDLSLSCVHRREAWLPRLADAIAQARNASCNPDLVVVVRGRLFAEEPERWRAVGADAGCASATELSRVIGTLLHQTANRDSCAMLDAAK